MATELLVENRIDDGHRFIEQLVRDGFAIAAAFWVKTSEEGLWHLYVASPSVSPENTGEAYRTIYSSLSKNPDSSLQLSEIKLINVANPIAREATAVRDRFPGRVPNRWYGKRLGNLSIEEAYIYPPPELFIEGFDEIKREFPSAETFAITFPLVSDQDVSPFMGKINESEFEKKAPGTLLFLGESLTSGNPLATLVFVYRTEGWNKLFRADTKTWEEVIHADTGKKLYEEVDFSPLAAMKSSA
jgi:hypothetical protein